MELSGRCYFLNAVVTVDVSSQKVIMTWNLSKLELKILQVYNCRIIEKISVTVLLSHQPLSTREQRWRVPWIRSIDQASVAPRLDSVIHWTNLYPVDSTIIFPTNTYPAGWWFIRWMVLGSLWKMRVKQKAYRLHFYQKNITLCDQ